MPIFADLCQKSVTIATSLERLRKEGRVNHAHPYKYLSREFGEDQSNTFRDNWSPRRPLKRKQVTSAHRTAFRHALQRQAG